MNATKKHNLDKRKQRNSSQGQHPKNYQGVATKLILIFTIYKTESEKVKELTINLI